MTRRVAHGRPFIEWTKYGSGAPPAGAANVSSYTPMRTWMHQSVELHRLTGILPEQFLTVAARHHDAVVAADQRTVFRCLGDDLAVLVHDVSHVPSVLLLSVA